MLRIDKELKIILVSIGTLILIILGSVIYLLEKSNNIFFVPILFLIFMVIFLVCVLLFSDIMFGTNGE